MDGILEKRNLGDFVRHQDAHFSLLCFLILSSLLWCCNMDIRFLTWKGCVVTKSCPLIATLTFQSFVDGWAGGIVGKSVTVFPDNWGVEIQRPLEFFFLKNSKALQMDRIMERSLGEEGAITNISGLTLATRCSILYTMIYTHYTIL